MNKIANLLLLSYKWKTYYNTRRISIYLRRGWSSS